MIKDQNTQLIYISSMKPHQSTLLKNSRGNCKPSREGARRIIWISPGQTLIKVLRVGVGIIRGMHWSWVIEQLLLFSLNSSPQHSPPVCPWSTGQKVERGQAMAVADDAFIAWTAAVFDVHGCRLQCGRKSDWAYGPWNLKLNGSQWRDTVNACGIWIYTPINQIFYKKRKGKKKRHGNLKSKHMA